MAIVLTRLCTRPVHKAYKRNLQVLYPAWQRSEAELIVAINGPRHTTEWQRDESMAVERQIPTFASLDSLDQRGPWLLPPFLWSILEALKRSDVEYIGVMDDDAYFVDPPEAVGLMIDAFMSTPKLGQTGAMGGLRKSWRYQGTPDLVEYVKASPWTTLGCQVYRREAILELGDMSWLNNLYFRADSLIALALHMHGWQIGEQDLRFSHEMSTGLSGLVRDDAHHERMLTMGENDWAVYAKVLWEYYEKLDGCVGNGGRAAKPYAWYQDQIASIAAAHRRTHTPHTKNKITRRS